MINRCLNRYHSAILDLRAANNVLEVELKRDRIQR